MDINLILSRNLLDILLDIVLDQLWLNLELLIMMVKMSPIPIQIILMKNIKKEKYFFVINVIQK